MKIYSIIIGLFAIIISACGSNSSEYKDLPPIKLLNNTYIDSTSQLTISLNVPSSDILNDIEKKDFLEATFNNQINNIDSILNSILANHKNMSIDISILYINDLVISAKYVTKNWINEGDTLNSNYYISYLRKSKTRLSLNDIATTSTEIDMLSEMINQKANNEVYLSPDVDITILGDSLSFHYDNIYQKELKVALAINDIKKRFKNFKAIYNE